MHTALSAIIVLLAIIDMVIGIGFFVNPSRSAVNFGLAADSAMGTSALRADFTAFFVVAAGFMAWGAWKRRGDALLAPLALFAVAFAGRAVNLIVAGAYEGWWQPMAVELAHVALLALAIRTWPRRPAAP